MLFNIPYTCRESQETIQQLITNPSTVNENRYLKQCKAWFEQEYPGYTAYLTTSCTRALELVVLSLDLRPGDEVILSPYTYVGVANAFANYGVRLVFVDIDPYSMNIDAEKIEAALTDRTRAVIAMHYAAVPCDLDRIVQLCEQKQLLLIEDNAQGIQNHYHGKLLGSFGDFSVLSFDPLKNISCNEGGVLLCKQRWTEKVDTAYHNGTNRMAFMKGLVNRYEWVSRGSKFSMSEYTAAVLYPLLERSATIIAERKAVWKQLYDALQQEDELRPYIPDVLVEKAHNAHLAYLKFRNGEQRNAVMHALNAMGVPCSFHYTALNESEEGRQFARTGADCSHTSAESRRLLRLPIHNFLTGDDIREIVTALKQAVVKA